MSAAVAAALETSAVAINARLTVRAKRMVLFLDVRLADLNRRVGLVDARHDVDAQFQATR
jgi:hypothetical protein